MCFSTRVIVLPLEGRRRDVFDIFKYDFGYTWPWTYGHLLAALVFGLLAVLAWRCNWARWSVLASTVLAVWAIAGFVVVHGPMRMSRPLELPTGRFLASGSGRVLDAGAGSGRSALMVLLTRPDARVVALDRFVDKHRASLPEIVVAQGARR